ncbi:hypothetical protein VP01_12577g1, partial [Puccinia sorghi]
SLLCHLAPYVFQTSISNLEQYLEEIEQNIEIFLHNVNKISARWLSKPKFHMLVHLPHSIRIFVYYGKPPYIPIDIGLEEIWKSLLPIINQCEQFYLVKLYMVINTNLPIIQNSMGCKKSTTMSYPLDTHKKLESDSKVPTPTNLQQKYPNKKIRQIHSLELDSKNTIKTN